MLAGWRATSTRSPSTCKTPIRSARGSSTSGRPRRPGSARCGRRTAGSCATPWCRWRRSPPPTERIKVGSGVIDIWTRNAARLASTFSTLDDLAPGRILCGLGAWWDPLASKVGIERARPLTVMREVIAALRGLLGNQQVSIEGTRVRLDGVELDYVYQERRPKDVPIYIGATGMQMMELAGEIADGVVLNYLVDPGLQRPGDGGAGAWRGQGGSQRR